MTTQQACVLIALMIFVAYLCTIFETGRPIWLMFFGFQLWDWCTFIHAHRARLRLVPKDHVPTPP